MTVCIGALCADADNNMAQAAVVASDRMVTLGNLTEFEHEVPKISAITDKVVSLMAGDALRGSRLARDVITQILAGVVTVESVAGLAAKRYIESRNDLIESVIFAPRGITMGDFYQGLQQRMLPQLAGTIDGQVAGFNYGVELLIAGVDDTGSHLFSINNPGGIVNDFQQIGYHAIGSGTIHALQSMIGFGHMSGRALHETVFNVYASKKRAEAAPGVGTDTDMAIISHNGVQWLTKSDLNELERLFNEYQRPLSKEMKDEVSKMKLFGEKKK